MAQTWTLSGNLKDLLGTTAGLDFTRLAVWVAPTTDAPLVAKDTGEIRVGKFEPTVAADGSVSFVGLPDTSITGSNGWKPAPFRYRLIVRYRDNTTLAPLQTWESSEFELTSNTTLGAVLNELPPGVSEGLVALFAQYADTAQTSAADAQSAQSAAEAARDAAVDISNIDTPDALVKTLVANPASQTAVALSASIEAGVAGPVGGVLVATRARSALRVAALGDSTVANEQGEPDVGPGAGVDTSASWLLFGTLGSGERIEYGGNFGVPGQSSDAVAARVADVIAAAPDVCVVLTGRNDGTPAQTLAALATIVAALRGASITPVLATLCPFNGADNAVHERIATTNRLIRVYALAQGLALCDFFARLAGTDGAYRAGEFKDATHPNVIGVALMAAEFVAVVDPVRGGHRTRRVDNTTRGGEVIPNGLFTDGAGSTPTGWEYFGSTGSTPSLVADADFNGRAWQLVSNAGSSPNVYLGSANLTLAIGQTYEASWRTKTEGANWQNGAHLSIELVRGSGQAIHRWRYQGNSKGTTTYRFVADHDRLIFVVRVQNGTAIDTLTSKAGEISVRPVA